MVCLGPRDPGEIVGPRPLSGVVVRPLNFTVRGQFMQRRFFIAIGLIGLLGVYGYATILIHGKNAAVSLPRWWVGLFPSPSVAVLTGGYIELIVVAGLALWLLRKLPSNNRWRGP